MVIALTVTAEVPVEERVRDWVAGEFRTTSPKAMVVALTLSVGEGRGRGRSQLQGEGLRHAARAGGQGSHLRGLTVVTVAVKLA